MTENGQLVKALDDADFNLCMNSVDVDQVMKAGKYIIAVDALWNESTQFDPLYQDIIIDIYSPE